MNRICKTIENEEQMMELGKSLVRWLTPGDRVMLCGVLGAGKTTLVRGIARGYGFQGRVTSPTFTLMNIYPSSPPIYHMDLYRLEDSEEELEWDEPCYGDGITLIEWPRLSEERDADLRVEIALTDDDYELPRRVTLITEQRPLFDI